MFCKKSVSSKLILPLLIILLISITGCGNGSTQNKPDNTANPTGGSTASAPSTTAPANSKDSKPSTSASTNSVVTYENYLKIKLDTTYDDVKGILGEGKKNATNADVVRYTWEDQEKNIVIETNKGKVESKAQHNLGKTTPKITAKQFHQLKEGMTIDQVVSILGPDYREVKNEKSASAIVRSLIWMQPDSKFVKVKLQDDKVTDIYDFL